MTSNDAAKPTLWFDVEDLFAYAETESRPSGIQRLAFEVHRALSLHPTEGGRVRFLRHHPGRPLFVEVEWEATEALFRRLSAPRPEVRAVISVEPSAPQAVVDDAPRRSGLRALLGAWASPQLKVALGRFIGQLISAGRLFPPVVRALVSNFTRRRRAPEAATTTAAVEPEVAEAMEQDDRKGASFAAGDVLVCLGSPWFNTGYASLIRATRNRYGVRFAVLVYDIIPVRRPEWCDHALVRAFRRWLDGVLPLSDAIFSISRASAVDLERYAQEQGIALKGPVRALPIGSGFTDLHPAAARAPAANPVKGDYALIVSTIEARKNHALLFRVWRRLVEELPAEKVPTLVFAGRTGWLVADLMQQLKNADYLGGKVQLVDNPSDAELNQLYAGCLFTLFPSLYEGWGLPVTESLMAGKPCLLSNRTSLPEAGGDLARYFDPENVEDAYQVVRATIEDRPGLAAWQDEVRARFQPVAWSSSAEVVLEGLDALSSRVEA